MFDSETKADTVKTASICAKCPVIAECEQASVRERDGMWAAVSHARNPRRRLVRLAG